MSNEVPRPLLDGVVFRQLLRRSSQALAVALGLCVAALLGLVLFLLQASKQVEHSDKALVQARIIEKQLLDIQSGFRGFRLSGDPTYLKAWEEGIDASGIPSKLKALEQTVKDDPGLMALVRELRPRVLTWFDFVAAELQEVRRNPQQIHDPSFLARGVPLFDAVMETLETLNQAQITLRQQRAGWLKQVVVTVLTGFGFAFLIGIPALTRWLGRLLRTVSSSYEGSLQETAQQTRELQESERRLSFLNEISDSIRSLPDPRSVIERSVEMLGRFLKVSRCAYASVNPDTGHFSILHDYTDGCATTVGSYLLSNFGPRTEKKMCSGSTLVIRDLEAELAQPGELAAFHAIGTSAIICCPWFKNGQLLAMMAVHQSTPRAWTGSEVMLVESVVERCWSVAERKRAETELVQAIAHAGTAALAAAESAERFRLLGDVISLQVWTATPDGMLDYVNAQCLKFFGTGDDALVLGSAWSQFVHPEDLAGALDCWQHSLATGERYWVEFRLRGGEHGDYRWFLGRAEAMRGKSGGIHKWIGTNTDIHKLKLAQSEAERASRAKDEFLATLSHELRTPLTPVLMTAAALSDDARLPADVRDQMAMMERNIALEARLIDDLLDLTTISRGKLKLRREPCDAHSLISLAVGIVLSDAQNKGMILEQELDAPHRGLLADPARFQQVIWNLLRNAVKFTPPGGRIRIQTRNETDAAGRRWFSVTITDTGIGIDPSALEKIFLPFEQSTATGDHRFGGVGLGLAIARTIVDLHGGRITARSAGRKLGATFEVEFPDATVPPSGPAQPDPEVRTANGEAASPGTRGRRILLVEDHAATLEALSMLLRRDGHRVVTASCVAEGLAAAAGNTFDLVISDLGLPDGTGIQLMEKLRDTARLRGIALSGYGMEDDLARCREAGFVAHLVKPVRIADLRRVIDSPALT